MAEKTRTLTEYTAEEEKADAPLTLSELEEEIIHVKLENALMKQRLAKLERLHQKEMGGFDER